MTELYGYYIYSFIFLCNLKERFTFDIFFTGNTRLRLLKPIPDEAVEEDLEILDIQHSDIKLPDDDTTYWCSVHKLSEKFLQKHHSIQVGNSK